MTESEEMYLLRVVQMCEQGIQPPIPIVDLAEQLDVLPVSANQMVHKLAEAGWLEYVPYKGVHLTPEGQLVARRVLHHRRLWEVFLVDHLGLPVEEADSLACRLEHITPDDVAFKLADFLGNPVQSPQGYPIPTLPGTPFHREIGMPLSEAPVGDPVQIAQVPGGEAGVFLKDAGFEAGLVGVVLAKIPNGAVLLQLEAGSLHLAANLAKRLLCKPARGIPAVPATVMPFPSSTKKDR